MDKCYCPLFVVLCLFHWVKPAFVLHACVSWYLCMLNFWMILMMRLSVVDDGGAVIRWWWWCCWRLLFLKKFWIFMNVDEGGVKDDEEIEGRRWRIFWISFLDLLSFRFFLFWSLCEFCILVLVLLTFWVSIGKRHISIICHVSRCLSRMYFCNRRWRQGPKAECL